MKHLIDIFAAKTASYFIAVARGLASARVAAFGLFALLAAGTAVPSAAREVYNIGAEWTFFTSDAPSTDNAAVVNLPHIQPLTGTFNYLKTIDVPPAWEGRRIFLRVGGAAAVANIFVDGIHTASHHGAASPFTVEITERLTPGVPAGLRIVVGSAPRLDVLPTAGSEKVYGGIFRGVELIVCEQLSISPAALIGDYENPGASRNASSEPVPLCEGGDGLWITTDRLSADRAEGRVRLSLLTPPVVPEGTMARVRFFDSEGNIVAQNALPVTGPAIEIPFILSEPRLWQGREDPYLYNIEVTLRKPDAPQGMSAALISEGAAADSLTVQTGFRTVGIDRANNFTLNGKPLKIRGMILHRDRMVVGTALTPFQIEEDVAFILESGANAVRVAGGRHSDYFYTLCNEAGLLVWNDGPFTGAAYPIDIDFVDTPAFRDNGRRQLHEMISGLYNHPSVAMWGIFSNVSTRTSDPVPYIRQLAGMAKDLDPGRLTAGSSVRDGDINFVTDMISFDLSFGWDTGLPDGVVPWLAQLRSGWPDLRAGISYAAGGSIFHQSERLERPAPTTGIHPEGWQTFFHEEYMRYAVDAPGLWGVFVGNLFDSGVAKSAPNSIQAGFTGAIVGDGIDDRGLVTFDRKDRKDAFRLYKAAWNLAEPFVHIVGSRLDIRSEHRQTVRVYSNLPEVELFLGGRSLGRHTGERGVFVWENVMMRTGINRLEARATGATTDRVSITVSPAAATTPASTALHRTAYRQ